MTSLALVLAPVKSRLGARSKSSYRLLPWHRTLVTEWFAIKGSGVALGLEFCNVRIEDWLFNNLHVEQHA